MVVSRSWSGLIGGVLLLVNLSTVEAEQYKLTFSRPNNTRMSWTPSFPSWSYAVPVQFSASGDSTSMLRISASASMGYVLDQRNNRNTWQDNASIGGSISYPILGPRASIGIRANMSSRSATLQKQKIRNQSFGFNFSYRPFKEGTFRSMSASVTPALITASRASRAKVDSTIQEKGIQYSASLNVSPAVDVVGKKLNTSFRLSKSDNTLKNNKDRRESLSLSWRYTLPHDVRTNFSLSESRSQRGVTRQAITEEEIEREVFRDTAVVADISQNRSTRFSSSVSFELSGFDVSTSGGYSESRNTNSANAAEDLRNTYFGRDRQSSSWNVKTEVSGKLADKLVGRTTFDFKESDTARFPVELASGEVFRDSTDDREDQDLSIKGSLAWDLAEKHSLTLTGKVVSVGDDNPGAQQQDRDAFTRNTSLTYTGAFASGLKLTTRLSTSFSHTVNLHASRSSNNSRNRDISLSINTQSTRLGGNITHTFSISARRTIFDFDRQINIGELRRKSNIRRGWSMAHSMNRSVLEHLKFNGRYAYSADDRGKLIVESGAQLVEVDNSDHNFTFGMSYSPTSVFSTRIGYTYRLDRQWDHKYLNRQEQRSLILNNTHQNLNLNITYKPSSATSLTMGGSRSRQRSGTFESFNITYIRTI